MKKRVIILGSTGFLGKHVVEILKKKKKYITIKAAASKGQDFTKKQSTVKFIKRNKPDFILNCASYGGSVHHVMKNPAAVINNNLQILLNLYSSISMLKKKPKVINAMANCSYSNTVNLQKETNWLNGPVHESVYSFGNVTRMKYFVARAWQDQYKIRSINLIFGGLYGPGDHMEDHRLHAFDGIILRMVRAKKKREKIFKIWGSGKPIREWIYVEDAARAMVEAINIRNNDTNPINISQNLSLTINKIAQVSKKFLNFKCKITNDLSFKDGAYKKILKRSPRFKKFFPNFRFTNFTLSVKKTVNYYQNKTKI